MILLFFGRWWRCGDERQYALGMSSYVHTCVTSASRPTKIVILPTLFKKQRLDPVGAYANLPFVGAKPPVRGAIPHKQLTKSTEQK